MILTSVVVVAIGAIVLSECLGRGRVVYTRMTALLGSYLVVLAVAAGELLRAGSGVAECVATALSTVPLMAAWLGFRIHLSNSITLELATLLADGKARTIDQIADEYGVEGHVRRRVEILQAAGYLRSDASAAVAETATAALIMRMTRLFCGAAGPRTVPPAVRQADTGAMPAAPRRRDPLTSRKT